ncbi:MAG: MBL fold metallo-hydrolase [Lachnospiraceae bacterium]|nr:MBL fold metallo-hydrolase [Lachnospiraceae bacterium]
MGDEIQMPSCFCRIRGKSAEYGSQVGKGFVRFGETEKEIYMTVESDFRFYPVGHGLFYAGRINKENSYLTFVYDCGSKWDDGLLADAIERNRDFMACSQQLDYLFISHLHCDHISGIARLIDSFPYGVRALLMPYVSFAEYMAGLNSLKDSGDEDFDPALDFMGSMGQWLKEEKIERLFVIGDRESDREINEDQRGDMYDLGFRNWQEDNLLSDEFFRNYPDMGSLSRKIHFLRQGTWIERSDVAWQFRWYVHPLDEKELKKFRDEIMKIPEFKNYEMGQERKELLRKLFGKKSGKVNNESLKKLKQCYEHLPLFENGGHNATSLVLVHRPTNVYGMEDGWVSAREILRVRRGHRSWVSTCQRLPVHHRYDFSTRNGTVLFGDINLTSDDFASIIRYFIAEWQHIIIATVQHHGSVKNWNENIFDWLHGVFWIVSSRYEDGYHHPDGAVVYNILRRAPIERFVWNHEGNVVEIHWRQWR